MATTKRERPAKKGTWGGARKGAGRKPKGDRAGVAHRPRPVVTARQPIHVTLRLLPHAGAVGTLRVLRAIAPAFLTSKERDGFRLVHLALEAERLHLLVEAHDVEHLSRGMQGLTTWVARRLNEAIGRRGKVFADRFHSRPLRTRQDVERALALGSVFPPEEASDEGIALTVEPRTRLLRAALKK